MVSLSNLTLRSNRFNVLNGLNCLNEFYFRAGGAGTAGTDIDRNDTSGSSR